MELAVKVIPNSKLNSIRHADNKYILRIKALPIEGKCNKELISFLSASLKIRKKDVIIAKGKTSKNKVLDINIDLEKWEKFIESISI